MLSILAVSGYRSLRDLIIPLDRLNLVTGPNGSGKSIWRPLFKRSVRLATARPVDDAVSDAFPGARVSVNYCLALAGAVGGLAAGSPRRPQRHTVGSGALTSDRVLADSVTGSATGRPRWNGTLVTITLGLNSNAPLMSSAC
jgi:hypothetical protein